MTTTLQDRTSAVRPRAATATLGHATLTLLDEHALLLQQVAVRAEDVLTVTATGRWPDWQLRALVGYLRAEVLRQVADEEWLLFPTQEAAPGFSDLGRDHVRLHVETEILARAAADQGTRSPAQLAATIRDLLALLERHLIAEEELLAAASSPEEVPATAAMARRPQGWYPLTEGRVIDLDLLPSDQVVDACVNRLVRLRRGEQVELHSTADPYPVWSRIDSVARGDYGFVYLQDGPDRWRVQVTRRS